MYLLSVLAVLVVISSIPIVLSDSMRGDFTIPNWVKNTAGWWADDKIPDSSFTEMIEFLIKDEMITVKIPDLDSEVVNKIPAWVKNTAGWWAEDKIHDTTFVAAVRYLVSQGIVYVEREQVEVAKCNFKGKEVVCSPFEKEVEEITDFYMEVNGSNCCLNWSYVGEEYRFQIETYDEKRGSPIDGVTITVKIISKGGELRHNFGAVTTEDGFYKNSIIIPSLDWYAGNILFVTGEYYGVEKIIEKEFEVFYKKSSRHGCSNNSPFSVASQDTVPQSIAFNSDGTKLFILGANDDDVNEYTISIAYCLDNPQFVDSFSVTDKEKLPTSVTFNTDGTKMFILGFTTADKVFEYTLSTGFDVSTASYDSAFSVASQDLQPQEIAFNADGTKMFVVGRTADAVFEYTLSTGFDVSTASYVDSFSIADDEDQATGIAFNSAGTKMFIVGAAGDEVNVYKLSTGFDVSTAVAQ